MSNAKLKIEKICGNLFHLRRIVVPNDGEVSETGRRSTTGNRVGPLKASWVRIPPSPPFDSPFKNRARSWQAKESNVLSSTPRSLRLEESTSKDHQLAFSHIKRKV